MLSGGGARGAYEVGVVRYLREELPKRLGFMPHFDILCGTSVGAINAAFLAATADDPAEQGKRIAAHWCSLRFTDVFDLSFKEVARAGRLLLGGAPPAPVPGELHRGGLLNTRGLERVVVRAVPWRRITSNLQQGHLEAISVSATHVATGRTVVFYERSGDGPSPFKPDPFVSAEPARIGPFHVLASAAIPVLFPAVSVNGTFYSDGGLRQNTPLSPALRFGADRVLVISLRHLASKEEEARTALPNVEAYPSPWFLFGKSLNALLLDRTDYDLERLRRFNAIIEGGVGAFGDRFLDELNKALVPLRGQSLRYVRSMLVRPSEDIGDLAGEHARSPRMQDVGGIAGRMMRYIANSSYTKEADLLSYVIFDGKFAAELIELGWRDARLREEEFAAFFAEEQQHLRAVNDG